MRSYKDEGIIFKLINFDESDRIISILTKYHGRVDCIAKGVRKTKSRKGGNIDIMNISRFSFARGKNLDVLIEVEAIDQLEDIKRNYRITMHLLYICEILDKVLKVGEVDKEIYYLTDVFIKRFKETKSINCFIWYNFNLIKTLGFQPSLDSCIRCNGTLNKDNKIYLSRDTIGTTCDCGKDFSNKRVSLRIIKILKYLFKKDINQFLRLKIDLETEKALKEISNYWFMNILEDEIKGAKVLIE